MRTIDTPPTLYSLYKYVRLVHHYSATNAFYRAKQMLIVLGIQI